MISDEISDKYHLSPHFWNGVSAEILAGDKLILNEPAEFNLRLDHGVISMHEWATVTTGMIKL